MRRSGSLLVGGILALTLIGSGCTGNSGEALDTLDDAQVLPGQLQLQQAASIAGNYFATKTTYVGFTAAEGREFEPTITWTDGGPAAPGAISVRGASATSIVFVTADEDGSVSCLGQTSMQDSPGTQDAQTAAECTGGW